MKDVKTCRSVALIAAAGLAALVLAVLQYRWVGQLEESERRARRRSLDERLETIARQLDHELFALHQELCDGLALGAPAIPVQWVESLARWRRRSPAADLVEGMIWIGEGARTVDVETGELAPVPSDELPEKIRAFAARGESALSVRVDTAPCLVVPVLDAIRNRAQLERFAWGDPTTISTLLLPLSVDTLLCGALPRWIETHFGSLEESDYEFVVELADGEWRPVGEGADHRDDRAPDGAVETGRFLWSRWHDDPGEEGGRMMQLFDPGPGPERVVRVVQRRRAPDAELTAFGPEVLVGEDTAGSPPSNASWRLLAFHRAGSIEALTGQIRRRNLFLGLGTLVLLFTALVLTTRSAARARRLAGQQRAFAAGVSHELRTPLSVIASAAENLADGVVTGKEDVRQYGAMIRDRGRQLSTLAGNILASGRPVRKPEHRTTDLRELLGSFHGNGALVEPATETSLSVQGDPTSIRSALDNVVQNAIKHGGPSSEIRIETAREIVRGQPWVSITVTDSGPGVPQDELRHLFDPFFRGRHSTEVPGSGLGLSVARSLIEAQGGTIRARAATRHGLAIEIRLRAFDGEAP